MKLKCIAIDDEPLALSLIEDYIKQTSFLEFAGGFSSASESFDKIQSGEVDVAFLDIQMPGIDGIEFAKSIENKAKVVFITAFDRYAIESYRVGAADYLLKPVSYKDFYASISRLCADLINSQQLSGSRSEDFLFVKSEGKFIKLAFNEISFIEGVKDYVNIHFTDPKKIPILSLNRMKYLESILPASFKRVHKSFIVNLKAIDYIERNSIVIGRERIPMGDKYVDLKKLSNSRIVETGKFTEVCK